MKKLRKYFLLSGVTFLELSIWTSKFTFAEACFATSFVFIVAAIYVAVVCEIWGED